MNAQRVWQEQAIDAPRMSLAYVQHTASDFDRRRRWRAVRGAAITFAVCAWYARMGWQVFSTKPLLMAASVCIVLGLLYCIYRLHRHVTAESTPADAGVLDTLRYQRRQLERQRDWRRGKWRWMLPAILPGYSLLVASLYFESDPVPWKSIGAAIVVLAIGMASEVAVGEWKARRSQREIDVLDSLAGDL